MDDKEYGPDIISVTDEEGKVHTFECLDRIETEDGKRYVALVPSYDDPSDLVNDDGELIVLRVEEEDGESYLVPIEDEEEYEEIATIFEDRLNDYYEIVDDDDDGEE